MATLAAAAARQAANSLRLSSARTAGQASNLIQRRGLAGPADHYGQPRAFWSTKWEKYAKISGVGWISGVGCGVLTVFGNYLFMTGGKVKKEEKLAEASH